MGYHNGHLFHVTIDWSTVTIGLSVSLLNITCYANFVAIKP